MVPEGFPISMTVRLILTFEMHVLFYNEPELKFGNIERERERERERESCLLIVVEKFSILDDCGVLAIPLCLITLYFYRGLNLRITMNFRNKVSKDFDDLRQFSGASRG